MKSEDFKNILRESIESGGESLMGWDDTTITSDSSPGEVYNFAMRAGYQMFSEWYDAINNTPITSNSDLSASMRRLLAQSLPLYHPAKSGWRRGKRLPGKIDKRAVQATHDIVKSKLQEREIIPKHMRGKNNKEIEYYKALNSMFKEAGAEVLGPGKHGLGFPKFETFLKIAADWDEKGVYTPKDLVKVLSIYSDMFPRMVNPTKRTRDPKYMKGDAPDDWKRAGLRGYRQLVDDAFKSAKEGNRLKDEEFKQMAQAGLDLMVKDKEDFFKLLYVGAKGERTRQEDFVSLGAIGNRLKDEEFKQLAQRGIDMATKDAENYYKLLFLGTLGNLQRQVDTQKAMRDGWKEYEGKKRARARRILAIWDRLRRNAKKRKARLHRGKKHNVDPSLTGGLEEASDKDHDYVKQANDLFWNIADGGDGVGWIFIKYIQKLVTDKISKYLGYESKEDEDEFRKKGIGKDIEPKLTDVINKIKVLLNKDHNIDTFEALLAYGALGKWFRQPKYMEGIILSPDSYGLWVEKLFAGLEEKNKMMSTKQIVDEVKGWINKSKLYQLKPPVLLKKMLEKDELQNLNNLNNALDIIPKLKIPSGFMGNHLRKKIEALMSTEAGKRQELNESLDHQHLKVHLDSFMPFIKKRLNYDKDPEINFISDPENGKKMLGKTAQYDPSSMAVTVFIDGRHPKDIMRSLSHELVHHAQNCDGQFDNLRAMGEGYAQSDEHLRKMEEDAYLRGNMIFRDWEDGYKQTNRAFGNSLTERRERKYYELKRRFL